MARVAKSPRFVQHGRGMVGLASLAARRQIVRDVIEEENHEVRQSLLERARAMLRPTDFENLVGELLGAVGFRRRRRNEHLPRRRHRCPRHTGRRRSGTHPHGCASEALEELMFAKPIVQQVRGSLGAQEQGLIVTTSDFSRGARG